MPGDYGSLCMVALKVEGWFFVVCKLRSEIRFSLLGGGSS